LTAVKISGNALFQGITLIPFGAIGFLVAVICGNKHPGTVAISRGIRTILIGPDYSRKQYRRGHSDCSERTFLDERPAFHVVEWFEVAMRKRMNVEGRGELDG
jgi:hypothetical protein